MTHTKRSITARLDELSLLIEELRPVYASIEAERDRCESDGRLAVQKLDALHTAIVERRMHGTGPTHRVVVEASVLESLIASIQTGSGTYEVPGFEIPDDIAKAAQELAILRSTLHGMEAHPDFEYATTKGPRKNWDGQVPEGDGWEKNTDKSGGWARFDFHEEEYYRRLKPTQAEE